MIERRGFFARVLCAVVGLFAATIPVRAVAQPSNSVNQTRSRKEKAGLRLIELDLDLNLRRVSRAGREVSVSRSFWNDLIPEEGMRSMLKGRVRAYGFDVAMVPGQTTDVALV